MAIRSIWDKLKSVPAIRLVSITAGALVMAVVLYTLLLVLIWVAYNIPGLSAVVKDLADDIGIGTSRLLEFNAIIVAAVFVAVQLWVTNRRADAAEATAAATATTAKAATDTAQSTVSSNTARQFKDAIEALGSDSQIVRIGGIQALGIIARDYPDYRPAVAEVMRNHIRADAVD